LVHGYILVVSREYPVDEDPQPSRITVSSILSLADYWSPTNAMNQWKSVALKDIPFLVSSEIDSSPDPGRSSLRISAHASPLCEDMYAIWVYTVTQRIAKGVTSSTVYKYTLSCPSSTSLEPPKLSLQSTVLASRPYSILSHISYSGHVATSHNGYQVERVLALRDLGHYKREVDTMYGKVGLRGLRDHWHLHISAYSGAVTYCTEQFIIVSYYR
jgi:hypothetical protein